jgi:hypothetical protein
MNVNNVQAYYKTVTRTSADGTTISEQITVDANTWANVAASTTNFVLQDGSKIVQTISKEKESYYDYENELNESKRSIKLLKPEFVSAVEKEFKKVIRQ